MCYVAPCFVLVSARLCESTVPCASDVRQEERLFESQQ